MGRPAGHALSLGELIDLELRLHADAQLPRSQVVERDARLGRSLAAQDAAPNALYRAWLEAVDGPRGRDGSSIGRQVEQALELISALAGCVGIILGAGLVWGWVAASYNRPINVVHFWTVAVGVQLVLLIALLLLVLLPMAWVERLPVLRSTVMLGRGVCRLVPALAGWVVVRLMPRHGVALEQAAGELRKLGRVYGRVRLLLSVRITQVFAVAFNVGAVASLVLAAYVTDPAFGWRSRLLEAPQVNAMAQTLAAPWSWYWEQGAPDKDEVELTKYDTLEERFGPRRVAEDKPWGAWWPFLVGSLVCYGLVPRTAIWLLTWGLLTLELRRFPRTHAGLAQLRERLRRPVVRTQAINPEKGGEAAVGAATEAGGGVTQSHLTAPAYHVLRWGGVAMNDDEVRKWLRSYHQADAVSISEVGGVDPSLEAARIQAVANDAEHRPVLVLVGAWEPPTGDYLDFLTELRRQIGERRMLHVMLYQRGSGGWLRSARPAEVRLWKSKLAGLGDPWLDLEPMVQGAGA